MNPGFERDRASAARASSWALWFLSLVGLGACLASIHDRDWPMVAALALVTALLALAAGHERQEMRDALRHVEWIDGAWMDEWAGAWR